MAMKLNFELIISDYETDERCSLGFAVLRSQCEIQKCDKFRSGRNFLSPQAVKSFGYHKAGNQTQSVCEIIFY